MFSRRASLLVTKQRFKIPAASHNVKNQNVLTPDPVDDDIFADRKASQAGAQILISAASHVRVAAKNEKTLSNGIDQAVCNLDAATFLSDVNTKYRLARLRLPVQDGAPLGG